MAERGRPALVPPTHASSERLSCQAHSLNFGTGGFEFAFYFPQHDGGTDIREYRLAEEYPPGSRISRVVLRHPPARAGATSDAKEILSEWTNTWPTQYVSRVHLAITCVGLGENETALNWLEIAYEQGSPALWQALGALHETDVGDPKEAVKQAEAVLALARNRDTLILTALAFARAGKADRARTIANQLDREYPWIRSCNLTGCPRFEPQSM